MLGIEDPWVAAAYVLCVAAAALCVLYSLFVGRASDEESPSSRAPESSEAPRNNP